MGDREAFLASARSSIEKQVGAVIAVSKIYETAPWRNSPDPGFLNQAIVVSTSLDPSQLIDQLLDIELELGRTRSKKWAPRTIDIDIALYDDLIVDEPNLQIPHSALHERNFALIPLAEIAGSVIHPGFKMSIDELLERSSDDGEVTILPTDE